MPNHWGVSIPGQVGQGRKESHIISGRIIGDFLAGFGKEGLGDVGSVEKTDHDAGHKPANENWLWDSTAYAKYFLWTRTISHKTGLPICGWQVSEGYLSNEPKWRDDAAETYLAPRARGGRRCRYGKRACATARAGACRREPCLGIRLSDE